MKIRILFDLAGAYGYPKNAVIDAEELIQDFIDCSYEEEAEYVRSIDTCKAVDFIAEAWGLAYEYV